MLIGQGKAGLNKVNLEIYRTKFQDPFLNATAIYYRSESANFLATHNITDYMIHAETRLNEESNLVDSCLHETTSQPLLQLCADVLIKEHQQILEAEIQIDKRI